MAGSSADFDSDGFREGIRAAMLMSMPNAVAAQPLFHFQDLRAVDIVDSGGEPFDWSATPTGTPPRSSRRVTCLIDPHTKPMPTETTIGPFRLDRANLYFFEDEWAQIQDFVSVDIDQITYDRTELLQPITLFDVTLRSVTVQSQDKN